jgi:hypothetical protein
MRPMAIVLIGLTTVLAAGCALETGESEPSSREIQEAAQDDPVTLPHEGPFSISVGQVLLGHPFHVNAGARVTVAAKARWAKPQCHSPYRVTLRGVGISGGGLPTYVYPSDGSTHIEHWNVSSAGMYRLEIDVDNQPACRPFAGHAAITSP